MKKARHKHAEWKQADRPDPPHPAALNRKKSSRAVRSAMRTHNAQQREAKYKKITVSAHVDQKLVHALIRDNQARTTPPTAMQINGNLSTDPDVIRNGWAAYYEELATP